MEVKMEEIAGLRTEFAVQGQKLESILETTKEIQNVVTSMQQDFNNLHSRSAAQDERLYIHEKKIDHLEEKVERNSGDIARLETNVVATMRTSRWLGTAVVAISSLVVAIVGLFR